MGLLTLEQAKKKYGEMGQKNNFIHWESVGAALQSDEWVPVFSEFVFDKTKLNKYFSLIKVSKTWYPKPETFLDIKELKGIDFINIDNNQSEIIEYRKSEVNINFLNPQKTELDSPDFRIKEVSVRVTKAGRTRNGDGTFSYSGPCSAEHNFWDKSVKAWIQNPADYKTLMSRQVKYGQLKEHSLAIAQTKARSAVIVVLTGLTKGFKTEDLEPGCIGFVKFVRSKQYQNLYSMAAIDAIRQGKTGEIKQLGNEVFGEQKQIEQPILDNDTEPDFDSEPEQPEQSEKTEQQKIEELKKVLNAYIDDKPENKNRKVIEGKKGALIKIDAIIKKKNATLEEIKFILEKVEQIKHITKIELPDQETDYFQGDGEW